MSTALFGAILDGTEVEEAVLETVRLWEATYLREIEEQKGLDPNSLPAFRSRFAVSEDEPDRWPEDQLPSLVVACPGTLGEPKSDGEGAYHATFAVEVGVIVSANEEGATNRLAKRYAAAVRAILVQHSSLGGFARGLDWMGEAYDRVVERPDQRMLRATVLPFSVEVDDVVQAAHGPTELPVEDAGPYDVDEIEVIATKETGT